MNDPFALIEKKAHQVDAEERAGQQVRQARARIVLGRDPRSAFFTVLSLGLEPIVDWDVPTLATDGKTIHYNPDYVLDMDLEETVGVIAHESLHVGLGHHARRENREPKLANVAMDLAINPLLIEAGYTLPAGGVFPGRVCGELPGLPRSVSAKIGSLTPGLSFEEYYDLLREDTPAGKDGDGDGDGDSEGSPSGTPDPGGCGGVMDAAPDEAGMRQADEMRKVQLYNAESAARQRGELSAGLARLVGQVRQPAVDWRAVLREFVTRQAKNDYKWSPCNRRFIHQGLYLPSFSGETIGRVVLAIDTSGSIGEETIARFGGEVEGIIEVFPDAYLTILYHDSEVLKVQEWSPADGPLVLEPVGGGGTDHRPVFTWLEKHAGDGDEPPACLICLTDLMSCFPDRAPDLAVLWATVGAAGQQGPFGQTVEVSP